MENDISEKDKILWRKVTNSTKKLQKGLSYIRQTRTEKKNKLSFYKTPILEQSKKENHYDLIKNNISQVSFPKNLSDLSVIKTGVDRITNLFLFY